MLPAHIFLDMTSSRLRADEDASNINGQFLLDETSLNPEKIFKRMSSIALGMFNETLSALRTGDKTNLQTIPNRDDEINRQYFLLVRFIRSTMVDRRLAGIFNLENIDILDYRIAGNILETAGDTIVDLSKSISETSLTRSDQKKIYDIAKDIETIQKKSINAFITNNRSLAIEAIKLHRHYQGKISKTRSSLEHKKHAPIAFLDLIYIFEKIAQSWSDISDLIQPTYRK